MLKDSILTTGLENLWYKIHLINIDNRHAVERQRKNALWWNGSFLSNKLCR